jgi:uncharacterized membrane protein YraQ (UPF0718 family)
VGILQTFLHLLGESLPLFLLGGAIGAALEVWLKREWVERWIGGDHRSLAAATVAGAVLPGCAMSTMPLAQSLSARGARLGTITAFIMIAPILSPHTVAMTATLISVPMALGRIVLSVAVSLLLGAFLNGMERRGHPLFSHPKDDAPQPAATTESCSTDCCANTLAPETTNCCGDDDDCCDGANPENQSRLRCFWRTFFTNLRSIWMFLVAGLLVAATLSALIPPDTLHKYLRGGWSGYLAAVAVGIPVYVCDGGEVPLTRALLELGVGTGPAFSFMLASVGTCLPTITMALRIIGWAATGLYLLAWLILSVGGGVLMGMLLS